MKIKDYKLFLENKQSKEEIDFICKKYGITNYTINEDGTVDVDGDVILIDLNLTKLPLKFGRVTRGFDCSHNKLRTLEGSPHWVGIYFDCCFNQLKTLEGGPETVIDAYICYDNNLFNFTGFPEDHYSIIFINNNPVYNLIEHIPLEKWNKFIYWCNEYDAIDDEGKVIHERMEEVYQKLGLKYED